MKYLKTFEEYKEKMEFGGYMIFPDFFKDSLLSEYYDLEYGPDNFGIIPPDIEGHYGDNLSKLEKEKKKKKKKLKKEILAYINEFVKMSDNEKFGLGYYNEFPVLDLDFETTSIPDDWQSIKLKTLRLFTMMGSWELDQKDFEEISRYLSDPELYLDTKKYNL